ncbi:hypothetical protein [Blastopirellula marina]|uniref:Uncharacterized protein n=1 Tax=Blastopirellula marina TaxID=124 RepID=A0A2S8GHP6_9BACT|nr:hypothetical protein [Blastopirellula marina]PQO43965.1 hypothetical protein C5Y93_22560 [Blastopirellula marina]
MVNHLFAAFETDSSQYQRAEEYWETLVGEVLRERSHAQDWAPWLNTRFADGRLMEPGNPIYHLRSKALRKGIRIIQVTPTTNELSLSTWLSSVESDVSNDSNFVELVIHCELSVESAEEARRLLADWA